MNLYKADPVADANKTFNITTMLNDNWDKIDAKTAEVVEAALQSFDRLATQPRNRTTDTLTTQDNLDTWTSVITDASGHEVARKVDVESRNGNFAVWTSTITIGDKVVTIVDTETANGWTREVRYWAITIECRAISSRMSGRSSTAYRRTCRA